MELMRCTMCRSPLKNVTEDQEIITCEYCDYQNIRPKHHRKNRYNIANKLREEAEFDKAIIEYEKLLAEDEADYTAHWGLLLCKYGIEYVEDPATGKILPTCHLDRIQEESIKKEAHYIAALEYTDESIKELYMQEASQIDEVRADIMAATKNQAPYDVFICYKSKDEWKHRTEDSVWAQDIYEELTKRGYRVFFADKTIELGMKYEPVIFHALYSAPIMIVVGTKKEYLNSTWVRNEWYRYQKLTKNSDKTIFLAFKDMDPNCFPGELKPWQAQDLSQIGAMQDLIGAVEKTLKRHRTTSATVTSAAVQYAEDMEVNKCARLLKNGETFLKLGDYKSAEEVYRAIAKDYPEEYRGWWGLIVCKTRNFQQETVEVEASVGEYIVDVEMDTWYCYVKKLSLPEEIEKLEKIYLGYIEKVVAWREVHAYVKLTHTLIDKSKELIVMNQKQISVIEEKRQQLINDKNKVTNILREKLESYKDDYERVEKRIHNKENVPIWIIAGIGLIAVAIFIFAFCFAMGEFEWIGVAVVSALLGLGVINGTYFSTADFTLEELKYQYKVSENGISEIEKRQKRLEKQHEADIAECDKEKQEAQGKITDLQASIWGCVKDLERGEQVIHQEICKSLCDKIRNI